VLFMLIKIPYKPHHDVGLACCLTKPNSNLFCILIYLPHSSYLVITFQLIGLVDADSIDTKGRKSHSDSIDTEERQVAPLQVLGPAKTRSPPVLSEHHRANSHLASSFLCNLPLHLYHEQAHPRYSIPFVLPSLYFSFCRDEVLGNTTTHLHCH
jgi:hypothetical protein